jgi:hypothetical protein
MPVHQIVYCSKNRISGTSKDVAVEIGSILSIARAKNKKAGISGALLFNGEAFAQVLEGPLGAVEEIFEHIQRDERHSDVVMLRNAASQERVFSDWSMAYADPEAVQALPNAEIDLDEAFAHPAFGAQKVVSLLEQLVVRGGA